MIYQNIRGPSARRNWIYIYYVPGGIPSSRQLFQRSARATNTYIRVGGYNDRAPITQCAAPIYTAYRSSIPQMPPPSSSSSSSAFIILNFPPCLTYTSNYTTLVQNTPSDNRVVVPRITTVILRPAVGHVVIIPLVYSATEIRGLSSGERTRRVIE